MGLKTTQAAILFTGLSVLISIVFVINNIEIDLDDCVCAENLIDLKIASENIAALEYQVGNLLAHDPGKVYAKPKLAVIVPYRNCFDELLIFAPHMTKFLSAQQIPHHIFVTNHLGNLRFNKGAMINAGYLYEKDKFDYLVVHDIDTLPLNPKLSYEYPPEGNVFHVSAPWLHPNKEYDWGAFLGGVLVISNKDFEKVNGFTNIYWGWGMEDEEFRENIRRHKVYISRPNREVVTTGHNDTFLDTHTGRRVRDNRRCHTERKPIATRYEIDGANATQVNISDIRELTINGAKVTVINIDYQCDKSLTPWCDCSDVF